jgi:ATP adenylyltransferase
MDDSAREEGCLFCRIRDETEDQKNFVLERGDRWYIIINRYPYTTGHVMVVCDRHVEGFSDLDAGERDELPGLLARCESALQAAYHPDGINVGANLGRSAGAGIAGHLHVHLVPRWHGDTNFMSSVAETRVVSEDLGDTHRKLKKALEALE